MSPDSTNFRTAPSVLVDLRPCYEGYAGIPQEVRLLFAMFAELPLARLGGLASGTHFTSRHGRPRTPFEIVLEQTRVLVSQEVKRTQWPPALPLPGFARRRMTRPYIALSEMRRREKLNLRVDPELFEDFLWTRLFDHTLAPDKRQILRRAEFFATELGHEYARGLSLLPRIFQRRVETKGFDVLFGAALSPYRVSPGTQLMIRYYDALPLLSPHTIGEPWPHAMSHARMLRRNMEDGAHFFCDSEPVREDLLRFFPDAERRVHTIPVTLAPEYRPDERPERELRTIMDRRRAPATRAGAKRLPDELPKYFMAVSTLEPRKNYLKLFRGFEMARSLTEEKIELLVVANPGWRSELELADLKALVAEGAVHLCNVPLRELRALYSAAHAVIAPSRAEGFDYSGAEAMACGTPVIASDIPVHRWVYGDAATYFDPYDSDALGRRIAAFAELPRGEGPLAELRDRGLRRARGFHPDALAPRWEAAIQQVVSARQPSYVVP